MGLNYKDLIEDCIEGIQNGSKLESLGSAISSYETSLAFVLVHICHRLEITENDDVNRRVAECMFALGLAADAKLSYLGEK